MITEIETLALKAVYKELDQFITAVIAGTASKGDIAKARAVLPSGYVNSFDTSLWVKPK